MAGGQGARLRPLTEHVPKPMLRVAGRPIIERLVLHCVGFGIKRIFVSVNYLGDVIEAALRRRRARSARPIEYLREDQPLGTVGALGLLPEPPAHPAPAAQRGPRDLGRPRRVARFARRRRAARDDRHPSVPAHGPVRDASSATASASSGLDEKPTLEREVNSGIYVLDPSVVASVAPARRLDTPDLIADLLRQGEPVGAFLIEDDWIDVGQRDQLAAARGDRLVTPSRQARPRHRRRRVHRQPPRRAPGRRRRRGSGVLPLQLARFGGLARRDGPGDPGRPRHPPRRHPRCAVRRCGQRGRRGRLPPRRPDRHPVLLRRPAVVHRHERARHAARPRGGSGRAASGGSSRPRRARSTARPARCPSSRSHPLDRPVAVRRIEGRGRPARAGVRTAATTSRWS